MFTITSAPSRLSRRASAARARRRSRTNDQWYGSHGGASLGETLAIGLGPESGIFRRP